MYTSYFGLREKPFAITPNPRYLFLSEQHREALAHLLYGCGPDGCIALLTGEVGTGKTTVCRSLLDRLPTTTDTALILTPKLSIEELWKAICLELAIDISGVASQKEYIDRLNQRLLASHAKGRNTVVIIDEAQNLGPDLLEHLRLLTNLETSSHKLLQIVLIGQPELRSLLNRPEMAQIKQRITSRYHLSPLPPTDGLAYIQHRLSVAAAPPASTLFSQAALRLIVAKADGVPRLINLICDRALLGAYAADLEKVDRATARRASQEVLTTGEKRRTRMERQVSVLVVALLLLAGVVLYLTPGVLPQIRLSASQLLETTASALKGDTRQHEPR